jgi:hypothetical protein
VGDLLFILAIAFVAAALGLGIGIVLSRTILGRLADRVARDDEEPDDRAE